MKKDTPAVSCTSSNGGTAADAMHGEGSGRSTNQQLLRKKTYSSWSEAADDAIEQYDEALRLLSK